MISAELIVAARAGDPAALDALLAELMPIAGRLLAVLRRSPGVGRGIDWEGLQQEVLTHVIRSMQKFRGEDGGALVNWLRQIVFARHRDALRKLAWPGRPCAAPPQPLDGVAEALEVPAGDPSPSEQAIRQEHEEIVRRVIAGLPERQRLAVRLRYLEGRSYHDVASELGSATANAARILVRRALATLRESLEGMDPGGPERNTENP